MQIVIEIPEGLKDVFENRNVTALDVEEMKMALRNGTVLPEHGRLIDADDLDVTTVTTDDYSGNEILDIVLKEDIDTADTILEAWGE